MVSLQNSSIEFIKALEELGNYLEQCYPPQLISNRMFELNKQGKLI